MSDRYVDEMGLVLDTTRKDRDGTPLVIADCSCPQLPIDETNQTAKQVAAAMNGMERKQAQAVRRFPIQATRTTPRYDLPWAMLEPHEETARRNHGGQTLQRLAERQGLGPLEALAVILGKRVHELMNDCSETQALAHLKLQEVAWLASLTGKISTDEEVGIRGVIQQVMPRLQAIATLLSTPCDADEAKVGYEEAIAVIEILHTALKAPLPPGLRLMTPDEVDLSLCNTFGKAELEIVATTLIILSRRHDNRWLQGFTDDDYRRMCDHDVSDTDLHWLHVLTAKGYLDRDDDGRMSINASFVGRLPRRKEDQKG